MRAALIAATLLLATAAVAAPPPRFDAPPPRLVVLIVVDQFGAGYLPRFRDQLGPDGLRAFMEQGAYWPLATYDVAQAMTGPGHATIATGAWPAQHGIALNVWYDRARDLDFYCVRDDDHRWVGVETPPSPGTSPRTLRADTLGDALRLRGGESKVVAVALKDRSAILLGGFAATAVTWFSPKDFRWTTSTFYAPDGQVPDWLDDLNAPLKAREGQAYTWTVEGPGNGRSAPGEASSKTWTLGKDGGAIESPLGGELTVEAALAARARFALGADAEPDLLAVSFSQFDMVGHDVGPHDRRMEALLVALDAQIAQLRRGILQAVPANDVLFVLTADHGVAPKPEWAATYRLPGLRVDRATLTDGLEKHLRGRFGRPPRGAKAWVRRFKELHLYLAGDRPDVRAAAAAWVAAQPGILAAVTPDDIAQGRLPPDPVGRRLRNQYRADRGGDVVVLLAPFAIYDKDVAAHLTGHTYDRTVPLAFLGARTPAGVHPGPAEVIDLVSTVAWRLGVVPPAAAQGKVLVEALPPR
ncbi:MAG: alkaline phosphatase family protein [Myxococcales bacterium]|nr:alkaline phosphatase family protein [Myxococcales bacterium]MCB9536984.1 alkaline phosphatase family protein [Myxococcales bacterium]